MDWGHKPPPQQPRPGRNRRRRPSFLLQYKDQNLEQAKVQRPLHNNGSQRTLRAEDCNAPHWVTKALQGKALPQRCSFQSSTSLCGEASPESAVDCRSFRGKEYFWTTAISQHTKSGQGRHALRLYDEMRKHGVEPSSYTFVALLKACSSLHDLDSAKQVHGEVVRCGFESDLYVGTVLVDVYAKCRSLQDARRVFDKMPCRDVVSWTAMIFGYAQTEQSEEALQLFARMQQEGVVPNDRTYVSVLRACSSLAELEEGTEKGDRTGGKQRCLDTVRAIHAHLRTGRFELDVFVGTMLVDVYAKCGSLDDAKHVFEKMPHRTVVSWNAMILGHAKLHEGKAALQLYTRMQQEGGVVPNDRTYVSVLRACSSLTELEEETTEGGAKRRCLEIARAFHSDIVKASLESDVFVATMLVDVYAKCGSLGDARRVFEGMPRRTVVSWNAMILGYTQMDQGELALQLYKRMQQEGVVPDERTYVGALNACGSVAGLEMGKGIHAQIISEAGGPDATMDPFVTNSLIDMYGKCGSMSDAQQVFDALPNRNIVTWGALIAGYAHQGESELVFHLFQKMKDEGVQPNSYTFLSVLTACSHAGLVDRGNAYFELMFRNYGITPRIEHYTSVVDLVARSGQLDRAMEMVKAMPFQPDSTVWECVLGACQKWGNVELARQAFDHAVRLDKCDSAAYALMANIYVAAEMWEEANKIQAMRFKSQAWKPPGQSRWSDMNGCAHVFVVGNTGHPGREDIYASLRQLQVEMRTEE